MDRGRNRRRVAGFVAQFLRGPDRLARHLVQSGQAGRSTARRDEHEVAVYERRLADQPADIARVELLEDVAEPDDRAVLRRETGQITVLREHVEPVAVDRRCTARAGAAIVGVRTADVLSPDGLPVREVEARDDAVAPCAALHVHTSASHGNRAVPRTEVGRLPDAARARRGPVVQQAAFA